MLPVLANGGRQMGWSDCGDDQWGRPIGYAFEGQCDQPGCPVVIDRGLGYCCGSMHGGTENGCGLYFCGKHEFTHACDTEE